MLVLSRKLNESIVIDGNIRITVVGIRGNQIRFGIEAPGSVGIYRQELLAQGDAGDGTQGRGPDHGSDSSTRPTDRPARIGRDRGRVLAE